MVFEQKRFLLKDGHAAVLRVPEPDDAAEMLLYLKQTAAETEFVLRYPEECVWTEEQERGLLEGFRNAPDSLMLACFVDGVLAGNCNLQINPHIKDRHRGNVAIALRKAFWGRGIGTAMFQEMIAVARARGVEQLELDYIEGNARARMLYEKMGFEQYAVHPDAIRLKDGSRRSLICMLKRL